ncbi:hypothetical protein [Paraburkholderia oxyphila]|uniref:hypothetical protein n=1 Tax=Paraburkholderia oxyphila TaxID=614212 RepID=UPI0012EDD6B8|nr:hypothetical protein [Paraburkholderia oxyphila]
MKITIRIAVATSVVQKRVSTFQRFLVAMENVVLKWRVLSAIEPYYPKGEGAASGS